MNASGIHLIAELSGCPPGLLNDENRIKTILIDGINTCGLFYLSISSHKFDPIGVTVISIINESHIAIHTYPEAQHASLDIFHCSTESESLFKLLKFLSSKLLSQAVKFIEIDRGDKLAIRKMSLIDSENFKCAGDCDLQDPFR
jgi:S-adenosylmethionine decarboxylase proenzyme